MTNATRRKHLFLDPPPGHPLEPAVDNRPPSILQSREAKDVKRNLLSIAGYDPSGGAGALLDVRVFGALGFHGTAVLTALTVQNTVEVRRVSPVSPPGR